jgi:hypothetical protein
LEKLSPVPIAATMALEMIARQTGNYSNVLSISAHDPGADLPGIGNEVSPHVTEFE